MTIEKIWMKELVVGDKICFLKKHCEQGRYEVVNTVTEKCVITYSAKYLLDNQCYVIRGEIND